jgi:hypothetical protein
VNHLPVLYNLQMFSFCNKKVLTKFVRVLAEGIRIMHEYSVSLSKGRSNSIKRGQCGILYWGGLKKREIWCNIEGLHGLDSQ